MPECDAQSAPGSTWWSAAHVPDRHSRHFPLKYFIDLVAAVSLDGDQIWERPVDVAVIVAWGAAGTVLALRRFRWVPREG